MVETTARAIAHRPMATKNSRPSRRRNAPAIRITVNIARIASVAIPSSACDGTRREGRHERTPRSGTEIGGRPVCPARLALSGPGRTIVSLPAPSANRTGAADEMQPAADGGLEQARHVAPGEEAADHRETEVDPADRRIKETGGAGP